MLEDQVANLLQRYLGNYVRGLSKEALKISVWNGDVELTNMQLKPEALNALKLPIKVKAGFLGSVKLKVPWSSLGQDPVLVNLDRIFLLAEPATHVDGGSEDTLQEAKRNRIRETEMKLLERAELLKNEEVNKSWLGSLISTIIGNLKLSISNIHIRYEDGESNVGHPFAAGVTLDKLSAFTVDDDGNETFVTGGALDNIQKSVELEHLAFYFDSDISPWRLDKPWDTLLPSEWSQVFKYGTKGGKVAGGLVNKHSYILEPVSGNAKYIKLRSDGSSDINQPLQKAAVNLDDVTICLTKDGYRDMMKLADNFAAFNQRLKYAHYRPIVSVKSDPRSWWIYACKAVADQMKRASGKLSWEQMLRFSTLRKKYISLYASLLKSNPSQAVIDSNEEIEKLDRELDIDLIVQWRMVAHRFVGKSIESNLRKRQEKKSWWSFGWGSESSQAETETLEFTDEDWERLNKIIKYKEGDAEQVLDAKKDVIHTAFELYMRRNASKLIDGDICLAELSSESLKCSGSLYAETKLLDLKLGSYLLTSPHGILAESATAHDSLIGTFAYKPFDVEVDWSFSAKASPCYATYLKDSIDQIVKFFESTTVSQTLAVETATAVQMTIDEMKRTAQEQMSRALRNQSRFLLDLDIAAPKITIPTEFYPDGGHPTKLLLDLGNLTIRTMDDHGSESPDMNLYLQFDMVLSDVSAFLVDGDYSWGKASLVSRLSSSKTSSVNLLPVMDKCGVVLRLQQIRVDNPSYPTMRVAVRVPSLGFYFSPARYHRLMKVAKIFVEDDSDKNAERVCPWKQADFEGSVFLLTWKGVANREAIWQRRYFCLVGPFLYILDNPESKTYKQYLSLRGKQLYKVPAEIVGNEEHILAICDATRIEALDKVVEHANALILRFDSDDSESIWHNRLRSAIYRASISAQISTFSESSSDAESSESEAVEHNGVADVIKTEKIFVTGVLDELKICFNYNQEYDQSFTKMLLSEEKHLFEFRAVGGLVEIAIKDSDMYIGTLLKSLEIEDLVCGRTSQRCYLARSFIRGPDIDIAYGETKQSTSGDFSTEGDDKFYEAQEDLPETDFMIHEIAAVKPPNFSRVPGLLPDSSFQSIAEENGKINELGSFVKAQIVIYDQNSPIYNKIDNMVVVTLATLSFFCRRPTIAAAMDFVSGINVEDTSESFNDTSVTQQHEISIEDDVPQESTAALSVAKGLLGKGKSRIIFCLVLNMAHAQIVLVKEDETKLATLSQDNLLTDIKVFPSSFSIKAAIGNLRISDDSLSPDHFYFWVCDMRNPGGSSFVEIFFSSYNPDDDDYEGYDYSLSGQLSEVRIVFLNRFIQEVVSYFVGLSPSTSNSVVKLRDQVTDSEKWFTTSEIEGSPAMKLDLSLSKPIIIMPQRTDSLNFLELDVVHITVQNTFQWFNGSKSEINAIHMEILTVMVEDINLNVGTGKELGESIIQDVNGLSIVLRRSLRDLLHQIPSMEATIQMSVLKAALSNKEYQIITECTQSNLSEPPNIVPPLQWNKTMFSDIVEPAATVDLPTEVESQTKEAWISMKVIVAINLVGLSLHSGAARDAPLGTVQVNNAWILYKSTTVGESSVSVTLRSFNVLDDRESTQEQFRLAIGQPKSIKYSSLGFENENGQIDATMLIVDATFSDQSSSICLCIQRPQLLVALDFLLAVIEFFVPTIRGILPNEEEDMPMNLIDAVIFDDTTFTQPSVEYSVSPQRPLIFDNENFDNFVYDGNGGTLLLKDRQGSMISSSSTEAIIYVGDGKRLQFKNVVIKDGRFLHSCIMLGANSSYSVSEDDHVTLECEDEPSQDVSGNSQVAEHQNIENRKSPDYIIEFQAISPELTFYSSSKGAENSASLSNKLLYAELDAFSRIVLKGEAMEMTANAIGLTMESNGVRILEPFDTSIKYSNIAGETNIHVSVSDVFMNFSFSILHLFLAVEEDILSFLRMTSRKMTANCSEFDKIAVVEFPKNDHVFSFWRPRAPPGFAVLGDYLTPTDKPPTKMVLAVNKNFVKLRRPVSFKLIWPHITSSDGFDSKGINRMSSIIQQGNASCSIWYPVAPKGYIALGCVVSSGTAPPPLSSSFCILASLVSSCPLRDCVMVGESNEHSVALPFWRVDNCVGTFLPSNPDTMKPVGGAYDLRHVFFGLTEFSQDQSRSDPSYFPPRNGPIRAESAVANSSRRFEAVATFRLVWWNQGSRSKKKLSIWRPLVPQGMVYFGDIAVKGYEPPNACVVAEDVGDELFKEPLEFQMVGKIKKQRGAEPISFWLPQAPLGYVPLGCIACKGSPKDYDTSSLRCIRSDMVDGDQFAEESLWDTYDAGLRSEPFSIWTVGGELGTFQVRSGYKKPPKRFAVKLAHKFVTDDKEDTVIDAEIRTFSAACFDDFGGLMVPLFNVSLSGIGFSLHGRPDYLNSNVNFSLTTRSYNDKYECWEPVVEAADGFLRYQYDTSSPGAASQLRLTSTKDLNVNVSSSNINMILQAYASWNSLSEVQESYIRREIFSPTNKSTVADSVHHKRNYYIIPRNKLGQNIFIRATEIEELSSVIMMPSGDMKPLKVPVSKNMMDSHLRGNIDQKIRTMVTLIIAEAQFKKVDGLSSRQYAVAIRLSPDPTLSDSRLLNQQQSVRTSGCQSESCGSSELECVKWSEAFFFKVDSTDSYQLEVIMTEIGKGIPIGFFSAPLKQIATLKGADSHDNENKWKWVDLYPPESKMLSKGESSKISQGKLRLSVLLSSKRYAGNRKRAVIDGKKPGFIQISPTREGPWTTVKLNYAAPAACWRLGNDVVASEVSVRDGNRYVNIRSLVSVRNDTNFTLDVCLRARAASESIRPLNDPWTSDKSNLNNEKVETVDFFEIEKYIPGTGWVCCSGKPNNNQSPGGVHDKIITGVEPSVGWEWADNWHLDETSVPTTDGWVYAPDQESLKWPDSYDTENYVNHARQRRWIRNRKQISNDAQRHVSVGLVKPGDSVPLPLACVTQAGSYVLMIRPLNFSIPDEYAWSKVVQKPVESQGSGNPQEESEICVSDLEESEKLLYCEQSGGSSSDGSHGMWFCLSVQATEIAKDIHSDPIQDWCLVVKSPLNIANFLPLKVEYSVLELQSSGHFVARSRGIFSPGKAVNVYVADVTKALFLSLFPQKGWQPMHDAVPISSPNGMSSTTLNLRSSISKRTVQVVLEQYHDNDQPAMPKTVRLYAPYWFAVARCPPLAFKLVDKVDRKAETSPLKSRNNSPELIGQITEDEFQDGCTIASTLNFKSVGLQACIAHDGEDSFGPIKDLSPLDDMDGSLDLSASNGAGNCIQLFITTKPCPYPSIPTKVICVRPYMTFTNRTGQDIFVKMSSDDEQKVLRASDSRVYFLNRNSSESNKLQVRLGDTKWSFPIEILKEDTLCLVLRKESGEQIFLKVEVRGYEEGSRFIVVFRLGSRCPIRIENKTTKKISICQNGFGDEYLVHLKPFSTTDFSWDDPYGHKSFDVSVYGNNCVSTSTLNLETTVTCSLKGVGVQFQLVDTGKIAVARFTEETPTFYAQGDGSVMRESGESLQVQRVVRNTVPPFELTIELGVLGLSVIDHRPRELSYLYLERVYIAYSTGYDGGTTNRFKLILGHLQLDNQLPLTVMPVLLAPEQTDMQQPVFKMKLTIQNASTDGIQVYPYVYIQVTEKWWRLNIHEPIIWAAMDFYNNLQFDRLPQNPNVTQVDPEIRIDLIDISGIRLKVALETAPAQRPHGVLGVWSPLLSAIGSAFKIQIHLRKVMHRDRFMRKSAVVPAITNRIWRDLIHNPLHLILSVDVLGMTRSTLASLSKGFAELSTDGQFLQLRSKQVWSRKITSVGDGIVQGTEALAQGVAFGVSGVVRKPVESARQNGVLGLAHGLGRAFVGFIVQPMSGALDFLSLTVDGIGASCARCFEVLNNRTNLQRIRNPRAIHSNSVLQEYDEKEALGQMILWLAEASHNLGCTKIFKEPSKFAWSDYYEDHFMLPQLRVLLVTNKRVMLLQVKASEHMDKKPSKIMWDVPWEELLALELAKAGRLQPSHLIFHLRTFKRSDPFARVINCKHEEDFEGEEPLAVKICSTVRKMWKAYQANMKSLTLKVPSSQRHVHFSWSEADRRDLQNRTKSLVMSREASSVSSVSCESKFVEHSVNFFKIWSSEQESKGRCTLCKKKAVGNDAICSIWRPACPSGYVSIGDIAHVGVYPPSVASVYLYDDKMFALPIGFDLVWRNCTDDYVTPASIWHPRAPEGFVSLGCVAVPGFNEPEANAIHCVAESLVEEAEFEGGKIWSAPDSYPWACHFYQVQSDALHFVALRQSNEDSNWIPKKVREN